MATCIDIRNNMAIGVLALSVTLPCCGCGRSQQEPGEEAAREASSDSILQPDDDGKTVVEKALKVVGDEKALSQWKCGIVKYKTKGASVPGKSTECEMEDTFQLPGRFRRVMRAISEGKNVSILYVYNHGEGWIKKEGAPAEPVEMDFAERVEHPFAEYSRWPMLRGNEFQRIGPSGERVDGEVVIGVQVRPTGLEPFDCFFARQTGLMLKFTNTVPAKNPNEPSTLYTFLRDYKQVQGCMVPMRIERIRQGETLVEVRIFHLEFTSTLDESLFAKP